MDTIRHDHHDRHDHHHHDHHHDHHQHDQHDQHDRTGDPGRRRRAGEPRRHVTTFLSVGNVSTPIARPLPQRLLGVWAHPDDECYLSAGLMARVVAAGGAVRLVCATRGELGTDDPELAGTDRFARIREAELASSLAVLGVRDLHVLGLRDGACEHADASLMADAVADHMAAFRPDAIVTFGPDGITGHPDHRAVCGWVTRAASTQPDAELLYATMTRDHVDRHRVMHDSLGLFGMLPDGRPHAVGRDAVALQCSLDHGELIRKRRALHHHGSQTAELARLIGEETYFTWWRHETYRRPTAAERTATAVHATTANATTANVTIANVTSATSSIAAVSVTSEREPIGVGS